MNSSAIDWTFDGTWPHPPSWFQTPEGRMVYVDAGPRGGRPVVLVHGNPTWGYLFRNFIPPLVAAGYRVIVPDHLGFGRSDKPDSPAAYTIESHARRFEALLESLALREATLVPHDWGGPIGLHWATRHPERIRSLALLNTFAHRPLGPVDLPGPLRLFRIRGLGELFVKARHAIVRLFLFGGGTRVGRERQRPDDRDARSLSRRRSPGRAPAAPRFMSLSPGRRPRTDRPGARRFLQRQRDGLGESAPL